MNAALKAEMLPSLAQQIEWLDVIAASPAYARLWVACVRDAGITLYVIPDGFVAGMKRGDLLRERSQHLHVLTEHMDAAAQRDAVITYLKGAA